MNNPEIAEYLMGLGVVLEINNQKLDKNVFEIACKNNYAKMAQFLFQKGVRGNDAAYNKFAILCVENDVVCVTLDEGQDLYNISFFKNKNLNKFSSNI